MTELPIWVEDEILEALAAGWQRRDPAPADLADRVILTLALAHLDEEVELLSLISCQSEAVGARAEEAARTLTFSTARLTILVTISERPDNHLRLDGWIDPPAPGEVSVVAGQDRPRTGVVDADGRFAIDDLLPGLVQLSYREHALENRVVAAPAFQL